MRSRTIPWIVFFECTRFEDCFHSKSTVCRILRTIHSKCEMMHFFSLNQSLVRASSAWKTHFIAFASCLCCSLVFQHGSLALMRNSASHTPMMFFLVLYKFNSSLNFFFMSFSLACVFVCLYDALFVYSLLCLFSGRARFVQCECIRIVLRANCRQFRVNPTIFLMCSVVLVVQTRDEYEWDRESNPSVIVALSLSRSVYLEYASGWMIRGKSQRTMRTMESGRQVWIENGMRNETHRVHWAKN